MAHLRPGPVATDPMRMHELSILLPAMALAALMGHSIQRGATCMVAAVDEWLTRRRASRLLALGEAAAWVGGGVLLLQALGWPVMVAAPAMPGVATLAGGEPGDGTEDAASVDPGTKPEQNAAPLLALATAQGAVGTWVVAALAAAAMVWRAGRAIRRAGGVRAAVGALTRSPHAATVTIGIAFLGLLVLAGPWAYTDVLADWARGRMADTLTGGLLLLALFAGAVWGGRLVPGRWARPPLAHLARCLAGGTLMGWGSQWIPGGNDGLVLVGLPLGQAHAVVALIAMGLTIAVAMRVTR